MIEIKDVSKVFKDGEAEITALHPTSLKINKGEFVAIVGPSGSGKSTLLTIIGALQKPTSGTLLIDEKEVYSLNESERSDIRFNSIGFVLQSSNLVPYLTIKEQFELKLRVGKKRRTEEIMNEIFEELSISKIKNKYPDEISGGERQRAAIGLALLLNPPILLTDEPTASLDTEKAYRVVSLFQKISRNLQTSVIMVTHDTRMLSYCDRVFEMKDGLLTER